MTFDYHRLTRSVPKSTWWKPIITGLIAFGFYIALTVLLALPVMLIWVVNPQAFPAFDALIYEGVIDMSDPFMLAFSLASVALMLPAVLFARLIMGPRPLGLISSVAGRLRWGWMLRLVAPVLTVYVALFSLYIFVIPLIAGEPILMPEWRADSALLIVITLLLVPVQATAEEYVFRGYLMQLIGTWLKHPAWAILLPVPLFVLGHIYDIWGSLDVAVFAIFAGWITWATGGLEAAIVAHVVNNGLIFILSAVGLMDASATEGSPIGVLITLVTLGLFGWWTLMLQKKHGIERVRTVEPEVAAASEVPPTEPPTLVDARP